MTVQYLELLQKIKDHGVQKGDRTGTGTISLFGPQMEFDLNEGFPLLTTKKLPFRWIAEELLWFLSGSTNVKDLQARGVDIWDEWATEEQCARFGRKAGDLGPVYGHQWRNFGAQEIYSDMSETGTEYASGGVDQIAQIVDLLRENPNSRRILLTGWNPKEALNVAIPPCHTITQFYVADGKLSAKMYQRSADVFLGVPFNIASYALLTHMLAQVAGLEVGRFIHTFGDVHIYNNHQDQVDEQLRRTPAEMPGLLLNASVMNINKFTYEHMKLVDYHPQSGIKAPVAI